MDKRRRRRQGGTRVGETADRRAIGGEQFLPAAGGDQPSDVEDGVAAREVWLPPARIFEHSDNNPRADPLQMAGTRRRADEAPHFTAAIQKCADHVPADEPGRPSHENGFHVRRRQPARISLSAAAMSGY